MKRFLIAAAVAGALGASSMAQAGLLTFNDPGVIGIDDTTLVATYTEGDFTISGPAASFLTLGEAPAGFLVGGFDLTPFSLKDVGGGEFSLLGLDFGFYELGLGTPGSLSLVGLLNGNEVVRESYSLENFSLETPGSIAFDSHWAGVTEVRFTATTGFFVDNVSAVPEPASLALVGGGLLMVSMTRALVRRRRS